MNFNRNGLLGTISFHSIIALLLVLFGFTFPWPPPETGGIEVMLGNSETGLGDEMQYTEIRKAEQQPVREAESQTKTEVTDAVSVEDNTQYYTQESNIDPVITTTPPDPVRDKVDKNVDKQTKTDPKKNDEEPWEDHMGFNRSNIKDKTTGSGENPGPGPQGSPTGSSISKNPGDGGGSGNQPGYTMDGRSPVDLKIPNVQSQISGKIVVEICIDRSGKVVSINPGAHGSTIALGNMKNAIEWAANNSRFNKDESAAEKQCGTITYKIESK